MRNKSSGFVVAALMVAITYVRAEPAPGLSAENFVDVGDSVSEMLDTSGLAFSTMLMDSASLDSPVRTANFEAPRHGSTSRAQAFKRTCPGGGSVQVDVLDADASGDLSERDRFRLVFGSCSIEGNVVSGRSEFVVASHRFEGTNEITELDFRFNALGSRDMRWTGAAHALLRSDLKRGTESYVVTYRDLTVTRGPRSMRWNFSVEMVRPPVGNQVASVAGAMTVDGMTLDLLQDEPFVIGADGHPRSGQVIARDRHGASLRIEAQRHRYAFRFFVVGNTGETPDASSQSKPYGSR